MAFQKAVPLEWRPIRNYEGVYEVCKFGTVRRVKPWKNTTFGGFIKPVLISHGYQHVSLCRDNKAKSFRLHKIVAEAFLGPCPEGHVVNHRDGVKTNNWASNLEYVTPRENTAHAIRTGLFQPTGENQFTGRAA